MTGQQRPVQFGLGVGGLGVVVHVLTVFLLFVLPEHLLGGDLREAFLTTLFDPVSAVGSTVVFVAVPILAGACGLYLSYRESASPLHVLLGFVLGGLIYAVVVTATNWVMAGPTYRPPLQTYGMQFVRLAGRIVGPALAGAIVGTLVRTVTDSGGAVSN